MREGWTERRRRTERLVDEMAGAGARRSASLIAPLCHSGELPVSQVPGADLPGLVQLRKPLRRWSAAPRRLVTTSPANGTTAVCRPVRKPERPDVSAVRSLHFSLICSSSLRSPGPPRRDSGRGQELQTLGLTHALKPVKDRRPIVTLISQAFPPERTEGAPTNSVIARRRIVLRGVARRLPLRPDRGTTLSAPSPS